MMNRSYCSTRLLNGLLCMLALSTAYHASAQTLKRPNIAWSLGVSLPNSSISATADGEYFAQTRYRLLVYKTDWARDVNRPRGQGLVSYRIDFGAYSGAFTHPDENGREFIVGLPDQPNVIRLSEWKRDQNTYGGGYLLPPQQITVPGNLLPMNFVSPLRDNQDRQYNRLLVIGGYWGGLGLLLLNPDNPSNSRLTSVFAHYGGVTGVAYDPALRILFTSGADGLIRSWRVRIDNNTPSLQPLQSIAAHRFGGITLAYNPTRRILCSIEAYEAVAKGWNVDTNGDIQQLRWETDLSPLVSNAFGPSAYNMGHPDYFGVYFEGVLYYPNPVYTGTLFLDPQTGQVISRIVGGRGTTSTLYIPEKAVWILNGRLVHEGRIPLRVLKPSLSSDHPVTALETVGSTTVAGYANGEVRSDNGASYSSEAAIIGLHQLRSSAVIAADAAGRIFILPVPIRTPRLQLTPLDSATSLTVNTSRDLVAVAGQKDGQAQVKVYQLRWNDDTPSLTEWSTFLPVGSGTARRLNVRFVPNSSDLIVQVDARILRWNWNPTSGSYQFAYRIDLPDENVGFEVVGDRLWVRRYNSTRLYSVETGAYIRGQSIHSVWEYCPPAPFFAHSVGDADTLLHSAAVMTAINPPGIDPPYSVVLRGEALDGENLDNPYLYPHLLFSLDAVIPGLPTVITAGTRRNEYIVGSRDGKVYTVTTPSPKMHAYCPATLGFGTFFDVNRNRLFFSTLSRPPYATMYLEEFVRQYNLVNATTGQVSWAGRSCDAGGCYLRYPTGYTFTRQLSGGRRFYTFEWDYDVYRFAVRDSDLSTLVYSLVENIQTPTKRIFACWWMVPVDGNTVGFVYLWPIGQPDENDNQYFEVRLRFLRWDTETFEDVRIDPNNLRVFRRANYVPSTPQRDTSLRWDLNSNATVAAIVGEHKSSDQSPAELRIVILNKQSDWQVSAILTPQDFGNAAPTYLRFHPTRPDILYIGLSNGEVRIYTLDNGVLRGFTTLTPRRGNPGAVRALDVARFVDANGVNAVIVFGGEAGISVFTAPPCDPENFEEVDFYNIDTGFSALAHIKVDQSQSGGPVYIVYGSESTLTSASLPELPTASCAPALCEGETRCVGGVGWTTGDVAPYPDNPSSAQLEDFGDCCVDDADLLAVLFAFGNTYDYTTAFQPGSGDSNCDGIVDDADLLLVLFNFGSGCN